ncbi:helix-turn-helix domain-containing protein [Burkholderia sp. Ac-20345]|nr:helix-turn-helix domain-containing protein [Burkholderia sp. Ac-20345]
MTFDQRLWGREIARRIGRSPSTVSRELTHNAATRGSCLELQRNIRYEWFNRISV